jgi:hypothetical protein
LQGAGVVLYTIAGMVRRKGNTFSSLDHNWTAGYDTLLERMTRNRVSSQGNYTDTDNTQPMTTELGALKKKIY